MDKKYTLEINYIRDVLGSQPADEDLRKKYITEKMTTGKTGMSAEVAMEKIEGEVENLKKDPDVQAKIAEIEEKGLTVFHRNDDGVPSICDVQVRGFMKAAFAFVAINEKIGPKKKKDSSCYGEDWYRKWLCDRISFTTHYVPFPEGTEIDVLTRPLRGKTMQGPRVSIAASERVKAGVSVTFEFMATADLTEDMLRKTLDRGIFHGISQWSNAQWGCFTYTLTKEED